MRRRCGARSCRAPRSRASSRCSAAVPRSALYHAFAFRQHIDQTSPPLMDAPQPEANYRELVENAPDIIYVHDLEGRFSWVNNACERITGFTREETLRKSIWDLLARGFVEPVKDAIQHKLSSELKRFEIEIV